MKRARWQVVATCALSMGLAAATAKAEVVDQARTVIGSGSIGSVASLTVSPRTISTDAAASSIAFGNVSLPAGEFWKVAPQYLRIQHQSNAANWAIRILTNNRSVHPTMEGKVLDAKVVADLNDDILGYGGLIGTNSQAPSNRVPWAWQVYKDTVAGGPAVPTDTQVGGTFNSPWAFIADASDCPSTATTCRSATPPTIDKTIEFLRMAQGDASNAFLLLHPDVAPRTSDGDIAVYITARFGGMPADAYSSTLILELYHL